MGKRFENEVALIADYKNGMTWEDLQNKYCCSVTTVYDVLVRNNVERKRLDQKSWSVEQDELFKKMYLSNCSYPEIARAFGIKSSTITWHVHRLDLPMRGSGRNNTYPNKFVANTVESNYWLGYIFADGHITYSEKGRTGCGVSLFSEKQYVIDKYCQWFGDGVHVYTKHYHTKDGIEHTMYNAHIGSKTIAKWFVKDLGISTNKHHTLNPMIDLNWDIIRGYFDGDGSMSPDRYLSMKSCSEPWLRRIQDFLLKYGIKSTVKLSYKDCYGLFIYEKENLETILALMYENPYYCHEYKHTNLVNRVAAMQRRKSGELLEA